MCFEKEFEIVCNRVEGDIIGEEELNKIKIVECGEPLVNITDVVVCEIKMKKERLEHAGENKLYARETVCEILKKAQEKNDYDFSNLKSV